MRFSYAYLLFNLNNFKFVFYTQLVLSIYHIEKLKLNLNIEKQCISIINFKVINFLNIFI